MQDIDIIPPKTKNGREIVKEAIAAQEAVDDRKVEEVEILPLERAVIKLRVRGITPLVVNNWSGKSRKQMADKQAGEVITKTPKNAKECYEASFYTIPTPKGKPKRYGFPAVAFKRAMVSACSFLDGCTKVCARGALFVPAIHGRLVEIKGKNINEGNYNETPVRNASGVADLRYRGMFEQGWTCDIEIEFDPSNIKAGQVVNLLNRAGFHIGIGEGRPEKADMGWGRFEVVEQLC